MAHQVPVISGGFDETALDETIPYAVNNADRIVTSGRYDVLGVHGFGILNRRAVADSNDAADALSNVLESPEGLGGGITGALTVYLFDRAKGQMLILPDPLGSGLVFLWKKSTKWAISSSLPLLIRFLSAQGEEPKKSLGYLAQLGAVGHGGVVPAPYEDVQVLPPFAYVAIGAQGRELLRYPVKDDYFKVVRGSRRNYDRKLESVASQLIENLNTVSVYPARDYICHLTGGLDSRTVLAGLTRTPYLQRYATFTSGAPNEPDVKIAAMIASELDLTTSRDSGLHTQLIPPNPSEAARWAMHATGGVIAGPAHIGMLAQPDTVILSGGYGEMLRGYYGMFSPDWSADEKERWLTNKLLGPGYDPHGSSPDDHLFAESMIEKGRAHARMFVREVAELGLPSDTLPEYSFLRMRRRYYGGEIARSIASYAHRMDPLYVQDLLNLGFSVDREERLNYFVQLDLGRTLNADLTSLPFDTPRISERYTESRGGFIERAPSASLPTPRVRGHLPERPYFPEATRIITVTAKHREEAARVGMPVRYIANCVANQQAIRDLVSMIGERELSETFNVPRLLEIVNRPPKRRPGFRLLQNMHDALTWFSAP